MLLSASTNWNYFGVSWYWYTQPRILGNTVPIYTYKCSHTYTYWGLYYTMYSMNILYDINCTTYACSTGMGRINSCLRTRVPEFWSIMDMNQFHAIGRPWPQMSISHQSVIPRNRTSRRGPSLCGWGQLFFLGCARDLEKHLGLDELMRIRKGATGNWVVRVATGWWIRGIGLAKRPWTNVPTVMSLSYWFKFILVPPVCIFLDDDRFDIHRFAVLSGNLTEGFSYFQFVPMF